MPIKDLIAQLQIILDSDGNIDCWVTKRDTHEDYLEMPLPLVWAVTKDWKKTCREVEYYNEGDQIVLL